jgi:hypothetical protein
MTVSDTQTKEWKPIPGFSSYQASHRGYVRSIDRVVGGRRLRGVVLKTRVSKKGYELVNLTDDRGSVQTRTVHTLVLLAHVGAPSPGEETCHGLGGPLDNRWPENIRYGTRSENEHDKVAAGTSGSPVPTFPCLNHEQCGNKVINPGRRCRDCVMQVGIEAAALLNARVNLEDVAEQFGYTGLDWVYSLAVKHGGYSESIRQARTQHPPWSRRVILTLRSRIRAGRQ